MNSKLMVEFRKKKGMRQADVAELLGVNRSTVTKWEDGKIMPRLSVLKNLAKMMDVSLDELMADDD